MGADHHARQAAQGAAVSEELPEGWITAHLADVVQQVPNAKPEDEPRREFGYVDISSICNSTYRVVDSKRFKGSEAPSRARRPIRAGDVLFSNVRTYLRNIAVVPEGLDVHLCSTGFTVLRPSGAVDPRYLFRYVLTDDFIDRVTPQQTGTHYPATSDRVVMSEWLPLPPLAEQKRIVAKVEELLAQVSAARERLARVPAILKRFRQAVLAAACEGRLTNELDPVAPLGAEWPILPLGKLVVDLQQGWSPKCDAEPSPAPRIWGVIKTTAVQPMQFLEAENKRLPEELEPREALELRVGDLLTTRAGPRVRAGVTCLVRSTRPRLMICDKVYRFRASSAVAVPEFVEIVLNSPSVLETIETLKTGTSDSGMNLTQEKFLALEVPHPPVAEQRKIVRRVAALFALADAIEKRVAAGTVRVEKLTQAVLAKAFRGELVPTEAELARRTGREYEPAAVLLERIRAEGAGAGASSTKRATRRRKT